MSPQPRRAGARWLDGDCPAGVLAIFDNGGFDVETGKYKLHGSFDRYMIFYVPMTQNGDGALTRDPNPERVEYLAASTHPFDAQGFCIHADMPWYEASEYRFLCTSRRQSCKWSDLPEDVKRAVRQGLNIGTTNPNGDSK